MVCIDEKGSLITAMVRKTLVTKFKHLLDEGNVYVFENFKVVDNSGSYKVVDSKFKIIFTLLTKIKRIDTNVSSIPMHGFQFASEKVIHARVNDDTILTDVIGCLTIVGDVETVSGGFRKRDLEIISEFSKTCKVTLWGEIGDNFNAAHMGEIGNQTSIIIITSTRVKKFQGVINFATSTASKIYVNLNTDYVSALGDKFATIYPQLKLGMSSGNGKKREQDEMFENRMDIGKLLMCEWTNKSKGYIITILGNIEDIQTQYGWFYLDCQGCSKKVNPVDGIYTCNSCNAEYNHTLTLNKLHLSVRDDTGVVTCVVLHRIAERMIDFSPLKLLNQSDPNNKEFPREITNLCGQQYVFRLQLSDYNIKQGSDNFTVTKEANQQTIATIDESTSGKDSVEKAAHVIVSKKRWSIPPKTGFHAWATLCRCFPSHIT